MKLRNGTVVVNEVREGYGLQPVEYGDKPLPYALPKQQMFTEPNSTAPVVEPEPVKSFNLNSISKRLQKAGLIKWM